MASAGEVTTPPAASVATTPPSEQIKRNSVGEPPPPGDRKQRRIYHYPVSNQQSKGQKPTLFDKLFGGCCASRHSQRSQSFMIVAEQQPTRNVRIPVINGAEPLIKPEQNKLILGERDGQTVILSADSGTRKVPKTNGILKKQPSRNQQRSRGSNVHINTVGHEQRDFVTSANITVDCRNTRSNDRPTAFLLHRPPSPSSQSEITTGAVRGTKSLPGSSNCYYSNITSSNNYRRSTAVTASSSANNRLPYPVEVHEVDTTKPSLDPRVITGYIEEDNSGGGMVNIKNGNFYQRASTSRERNRQPNRTTTSYYASSEDPEPLMATATVSAMTRDHSNFSRSRSFHCRTPSPGRQHYAPVATTLTPAQPNTVMINVAGPPRTISTTKYRSSSKHRSPSYDAKTNIRVEPRQPSRKITYAPPPGRGETITVNATGCRPWSPTPKYPPQQPYLSRSKSPSVPSVPVGSKIDVTMRSHGQLVDPSPAKHGSSVRYTYETEFDDHKRCSEECEECNDYRRLHPQQLPGPPYPKEHHQSRHQQYLTTGKHSPTKVQVGDMVDDYRSVYHSIDSGSCSTSFRATAPHQNSYTKDETPLRGKTVIVTKQGKNNKRILLESLNASRKQLEQIDGDLKAALERLHNRTTRQDALPLPTYSAKRQESTTIRYGPPTAPKPNKTAAYLPISTPADVTISSSSDRRISGTSSISTMPMGSNIVLITIADDGAEERLEENEQIIYSRSPPVREVMVCQPPRRVEIQPPKRQAPTPTPPLKEEPCRTPGPPDQYDYTDKKNVAVVSPHGTIGNIFHQLTHGKLPDFVHQRFNVEHSEEEIHNDDVDLCHADGSNVGRLEGFQNLDTIYELINMGIENAQAKVCFKVTCQRIEPVNPRAGIWKRKSVTASRVLNIDLSQNDELRNVLQDIQSAPGESVRMIMSTDVDSANNVTTREKQLDTSTTAWAVAEILGKTIDQQGAAPISPRSVEGGPMKFLSPSKFAEEVYNADILGTNGGKELSAVQFSTRRGSPMPPPSNRPWTTQPPPAYRPSTIPIH